MARAGILYSQVAKAATALAAAGANPTVDAVRAALGDTGSRSTIGPMLRQWRHEHQDQATAAAASLPADLLETVQAVHQRIEGRAQARIDEAYAAHERERVEMAQQLASAREAGKALRAERDDLTSQLEAARDMLERVQKERHEATTQVARLEADRDGQLQRLADRAAEITLLAGQLTSAREQFEHYQDAASAQRERDRSGYESRIAGLNLEVQQLATRLQEQQLAVSVLQAEKHDLESRCEKANTEARQYLGDLYTLRDQVVQASLLGEQLAVARELAGARHFEAELASARLQDAQQELDRYRAKVDALEHKIAVRSIRRNKPDPTGGDRT